MAKPRRLRLYMLFCITTATGGAGALYHFESARRTFLLPGVTTSGHYQIELDCLACHTPMLGVMTDACTRCHGQELEVADDSHPASKFRDPRTADLLQKLDALDCVTCHVEHRADVTFAMGVTQPPDYCFHCHAEIGQDRPTHRGLAFDTCQSAGCHNYHDNRALHIDFLARELVGASHVAGGHVPALSPRAPRALGALDADAPGRAREGDAVAEWAQSAHAAARVNCSGCHAPDGADWQAAPGLDACRGCHGAQTAGFESGKHGMRLSRELAPMRPREARLPMRASALDHELGCQSCHRAHRYDRSRAAVEACLACHDDEHSRAYPGSTHHALFLAELAGRATPGSGVSCATCHLPRQPHPDQDEPMVQHNQNDNLRPNEKMLRPVCGHCHGVGFTLDALADRALIARNFTGRPSVHVESLDMVRDKLGSPTATPPPSTRTQPEESP